MDTNIDMRTTDNKYDLCLISKKRYSSQPLDLNFPITMTPLPSRISNLTHVNA